MIPLPRLDASPDSDRGAQSGLRRYARACIECGRPFTAVAREAEFCGTICRKAFNNRRMQRGATMYDLIMALRFDRPLAKQFAAWTMLCRMASDFRKEDIQARAGRKSWRHPKRVLDRHTHLYSISTDIRRRGGK